MGTVSIGRPSACNWAMRRTAPVPTRAPDASWARVRPTSASRGSSRGGTAAMTNPAAGAVGRSLYEWTATSISLASSASRSAETKTPTPSWATGAVDRSPLVTISTSSTGSPVRSSIARAMSPACAIASALPLVPSLTPPPGSLREALWSALFRRRCAPQSRGRRASLRSRVDLRDLGDRAGGGYVEVEQFAQQLRVPVAARPRRQFAHLHGGLVQQPLHDPVQSVRHVRALL